MKRSSIVGWIALALASTLVACGGSDTGGDGTNDAGADTTTSGDSATTTDAHLDAPSDTRADVATDAKTDAASDTRVDAPGDAPLDGASDTTTIDAGDTTEACVATDWYPDCDGDGYGSSGAVPTVSCGEPPSSPPCVPGMPALWSSNDLDCQDFYATVHPGAAEVCDGFDTNCDGTKETDADADGHYALGTCPGADDCNDADRNVHPGADYSSVGICPTGSIPCLTSESSASDVHVLCWSGSTCPASPSCDPTAPGACPPPATWDYDCSGTVEMEPAGDGTCSGIFTCHPPNGVQYTTPTPECGATPVSLYVCADSGSGCKYVGVGTGRLPCK